MLVTDSTWSKELNGGSSIVQPATSDATPSPVTGSRLETRSRRAMEHYSCKHNVDRPSISGKLLTTQETLLNSAQ